MTKANPPAEQPAGGMIPVDVAARLVMVTPRRIQQLAREGYIPPAIRGRYQMVGVVQGYIKSLTDEKRSQSRNEHENRIRDARAREIELRIAEKDGVLIDLEEHEAVLDEIVGMFREATGGLPARLTRDPVKRREIEDQVNELLSDIAARLDKRSRELRESGAVSEAEGPNDA